MNPNSNLKTLATKFSNRLGKLRTEALLDPSRIDRYCIISISQLNNFLRSYLLSIRTGAHDSNGTRTSFNRTFASDAVLIDEIVKIGNPKRWRPGNVGVWLQKDEPALHAPNIFLRVANGLGCSNIATITTGMADSWKVDVLRDVRNYFAHRCESTEKKAIHSVRSRYAVDHRAARILLERDTNLAQQVIDDIHDSLTDFSKNIS